MRHELLALLAATFLAGCGTSTADTGVDTDAADDTAMDDTGNGADAADDTTNADAADDTTNADAADDTTHADAADDGTTSDSAPGDTTASDTTAADTTAVDTTAADTTPADSSTDTAADAASDAPCPLLTVSCPTGCCAVPAVELAPNGSAPAVAYDAAGYIYVAYTIVRSTAWGEGFAVYDPTSSTWSNGEVGLGGYSSRVIVSATGRVHHLYGGDSQPYVYRYSDDHGKTWTTNSALGAAGIGGRGDMAIGAGDVPHVVYQPPGPSVWIPTIYAKWNGTSWTKTTIDTGTTQDSSPSISLGFADRPHIFATAYHPDGVSTSSVRHAFYDGAAWVYENIETGNTYDTSAGANDPYSVMRSELFADDSVRVEYARLRMAKLEYVRADRTPGATGTWTVTTVAGVTAPFKNALYIDSIAAAPAVVADGLTLYRPDSGGTFVASTPAMMVGAQPGFAVRGSSILVAYRSTAASTSGRLYFSRINL